MPSVNVEGVRLNYIEQGKGDDVIVFVHGFAAAAGIWKEVLEALPTEYHAYALDLRGFGQSEKVKEGFTIAQFAQDVYNFSQELGLGRFTYVGHSMGGAIALQLALDHPEVLKAMVLTASVPAHGMAMGNVPGMTQDDMRNMMQNMVATAPEAMRGLMAFAFTTPPSEQRLQEVVDYALGVDREALFSMGDLRLFNVEPRLAEIDLPTLMISGDKDATNPLDDLRRTATEIAGSRFEVFEGLGHMLHMESPQGFVELLTSFIEEVNRG
jgi:pimeloyl-ACP methyl ester carboxylesterase